MKKHLVKVMKVLFLSITISLLGCQNNTISESLANETKTETWFTNTEEKILASNYHYKQLLQGVNIQKNEDILSLIENSQILKDQAINISQLDLTDVLVIDWTNKKSYSIRFKNNPQVVFSFIDDLKKIDRKSIDANQVNQYFITSVDTTADGTGSLSKITSEGNMTAYFDKGVLIEENSLLRKNPFRQCFDGAYDTICDGFWGCMSWYTQTSVPVVAMVYCAVVN